MIHSAFGKRRRSFFVGFSALWAPTKPVNELAVNTDPIQVRNLCSPVPPPVLPDVMDVSTITTPPLTSTVGPITDSVEHWKSASLLQEADKLERFQGQLNECSSQRERQQELLAHMTTRVNQCSLNIKRCGAIFATPSPAWRTCRKPAKSLKTKTAPLACSSGSCTVSLNLLTALTPKIVTTICA